MHSSTTPQAAPRILPLNYPLPIPLRLQLAAPHHPYPRPCLLSQSFCYSQLTRYHLHRIARLLASLQDTALIGAGMGWDGVLTVTSLACFLLENRCGRVETGGGIVVLMRGDGLVCCMGIMI